MKKRKIYEKQNCISFFPTTIDIKILHTVGFKP